MQAVEFQGRPPSRTKITPTQNKEDLNSLITHYQKTKGITKSVRSIKKKAKS
jgi:hypothetical protein